MQYQTRNNAFRAEEIWRLAPPNLLLGPADGVGRSFALADVVEFRLTFAPTRVEPNRYRCELRLVDGASLEFFNRCYVALGEFRETSAEYTDFVFALHDALRSHAPACRFSAGSGRVRWLVNLASLLFAGAVLIGAVFFLFTGGWWWLLFAKLTVLGLFLPLAGRWIQLNRPRSHRWEQIPPEVLPRPSASHSQPRQMRGDGD